MKIRCPWCRVADPPEDVDPDDLCLGHYAEHQGLTPNEVIRMERIQAEEASGR